MKQKIFIAGSALISLAVNLFGGWDTAFTLLVLVLFALVFMGYMSKVVFFSIAGVIAIGQITWVITARYLDKNTS